MVFGILVELHDADSCLKKIFENSARLSATFGEVRVDMTLQPPVRDRAADESPKGCGLCHHFGPDPAEADALLTNMTLNNNQ